MLTQELPVTPQLLLQSRLTIWTQRLEARGYSGDARAGTLVYLLTRETCLLEVRETECSSILGGLRPRTVGMRPRMHRVPGERPRKGVGCTTVYRFGDPALATQVLLCEGTQCLGPHLGAVSKPHLSFLST